jgi:uncharacterized protein YjbJ (UPF0337 family)
MNSDIFKGQWNQFKGEAKRQWGKLTDDDMMQIQGDYDKFVGTLQERYGWDRERAKREVDSYFGSQRNY